MPSASSANEGFCKHRTSKRRCLVVGPSNEWHPGSRKLEAKKTSSTSRRPKGVGFFSLSKQISPLGLTSEAMEALNWSLHQPKLLDLHGLEEKMTICYMVLYGCAAAISISLSSLFVLWEAVVSFPEGKQHKHVEQLGFRICSKQI